MQQKLMSPFRRLRNFGLTKQRSKEAQAAIDDVPLPSVSKCMQDASDMHSKYEGLMANGQLISGAAYDFARALEEMAVYMMDSFGTVVEDETGNIFSLLAKLHFEIAKLLDLFANHVSKTIIKPTTSLIKKIQEAEIMKNAYNEERKLYVLSLMQTKSSKAKRGKGSLGDKIAADEKRLQEKASRLTSYVRSLEHNHLENLVTQGVQYHSAHMHLFSKGFGSVNALDPMIKQVALSRMIETTLSDEETSVNEFIYSSEMKTKENAQEYNSHSESTASSPKPILVEQTDPPRLSGSSDEHNQRRPVMTSKSAPISPLLNSRGEARGNARLQTPDTEHESVAMYVLPSPINENGIETIKKLEKRLQSLSTQEANLGGGNAEEFCVKSRPELSLNGLSPQRQRIAHVQQHEHAGTKCIPSKDLKLFVDRSNDDFLHIAIEEKGKRYTQSGPLIESPSSIKHESHNEGFPKSLYEEIIPPSYKSAPIRKSPLFSGTLCDLFPPPPSMPHISELHKLPLPPSGYVTPPKSPNNMPQTITHSAPLRKLNRMGDGKSFQITPFLSSSPSMMARSLSISTPRIQFED